MSKVLEELMRKKADIENKIDEIHKEQAVEHALNHVGKYFIVNEALGYDIYAYAYDVDPRNNFLKCYTISVHNTDGSPSYMFHTGRTYGVRVLDNEISRVEYTKVFSEAMTSLYKIKAVV